MEKSDFQQELEIVVEKRTSVWSAKAWQIVDTKRQRVEKDLLRKLYLSEKQESPVSF